MIKTRTSKFNVILNRFATTEDGKFFFKYLKEEFIDPTALSSDNDIHKTMVKLGQKELAQRMVLASKLQEVELDAVSMTIINDGE